MCPGVVSDWPDKCPVCHMTLVRRTRGDAVVLPDGVVARMQLSPYRIQLAGVRTAPARYEALTHEVVGMARIDGLDLSVPVFSHDAAFLKVGGKVQLSADGTPGPARAVGTIKAIHAGRIDVALPPQLGWLDGILVSLRASIPLTDFEPYRSRTNPPPLPKVAKRVVFVCPNHPDHLHETPGKCPIDKVELMRRPLAENERLDWWCPMHPAVVADKPGGICNECKGMPLLARIQAYAPQGTVLAIPRSAVVDTGSRKIVYVETMPGMFDGRVVELGTVCGDFYPVLSGLAENDRVVAVGAFLLDAETRLNPSLAAAYFGANRPSATEPPPPKANQPPQQSPGKRLSPQDLDLVARQKTCPVTDEPLDSMGGPVRMEVQGRVVFLCCQGCESSVRKNPQKYLAKLPTSDKKP
jgi:hypothetical protein